MKQFAVAAASLLFCCASFGADLVPVPELGLRLQRGFTISLVADNDTAPDTWCMTFDARGRLVVGNAHSIRTLLDTDGNGVADTAQVFAPLNRGAMGLCFDGTLLYALADEALLRFQDSNGDGVADGPAEKLFSFGFGEHGAHAIRKGPDGWWYLMGGNDARFGPEHITIAESPLRKIEAGALLRLTPDGQHSECIAEGFRNCYDFDFNALGDLFTYDSDTERDIFLPWYMPTRLYHVGYAQHHGWRLTGYKRSWQRPGYYEDTVPMLWRVGRGSPTGVTVYRHTQFPPAYRGGLFFCDWTFGRVYFAPLTPQGATYAATGTDIFLEPMDTQGFAPTGVAVSPDGALYVSIGGRKTRGGVYRIEYAGVPGGPLILPLANPEVNAVLFAPQPLDAWSRAIWFPMAQRVGAQPFAMVAVEEGIAPVLRVRAIEVLTEVFGALPAARVPVLAQSAEPTVRARVAWALGRAPDAAAATALAGLAMDGVPLVRRCALEAMIDHPTLPAPADLARVVLANMSHADKRVRLAATRLASLAPDEAWRLLVAGFPAAPETARISAVQAEVWRTPDSVVFPLLVPRLTNILAHTRDDSVRLDATRLLILAMGDWHLNDPSA